MPSSPVLFFSLIFPKGQKHQTQSFNYFQPLQGCLKKCLSNEIIRQCRCAGTQFFLDMKTCSVENQTEGRTNEIASMFPAISVSCSGLFCGFVLFVCLFCILQWFVLIKQWDSFVPSSSKLVHDHEARKMLSSFICLLVVECVSRLESLARKNRLPCYCPLPCRYEAACCG